MKTVIDDTMAVLASTGIDCERIETRPGFFGFLIKREPNRKAYFVWRSMSQDDYQFMGAKFWADDQPTLGATERNLIMAISKVQNLQ
jgi:hypothetical protein